MDSEIPNRIIAGFHNEAAVKNMKYSKIGKCDIELSKLGFGGAALGNCYGNINEAEAVSFVKEGLKQGINFIDTSPYYGHTMSESLIGKALAGVPREAFYICTKAGRYGTSWADFFDHSAERILKEFDKSLDRLGLEYVDILLAHDIEFSPIDQILKETLPALQSLKDKKKARYIGISGYPLSVLWEVVEKSTVKIDVVLSYARSCLFDNSMKTYASFFQSHNVGLINASLTGMGLLTNNGPPEWHPAASNLRQLCREAAEYAKEQGVELARLAIYDSMQQPWFSTHLVGMKTTDELKNNLDIVTTGLSEKEFTVLKDVKTKFFDGTKNQNWEGVELEQYRKFKEAN